ncbi:UMP-CMP kinase-like [Manduca sexta]|uniref:UMP-CMP kinase-like n=1 Tax=Manduca sexta TaxID=7130 RepID=UPI00188F06CF|nr:UMP-CMP kinase-like [Manduca sexta]
MLNSTLRQCSRYLNKMVPEVVFVLGAPGSGKGTQCSFISKEYDFVHLSAGDLLREERQRQGSEYGEMIEQKIRNGEIVPVEVTCSLLHKAMQKSGKSRFLIDGFPRNKDNLDGWERVMSDKTKLLFVLFFECSRDLCTERCLGRGAAGSGRSDDNLESLQKRFNTYLNDTMPIIQHYDQLGLVRRINAEVGPQQVFEDVKKVFNKSDMSRIAN